MAGTRMMDPFNQEKMRRKQIAADQHGRKWFFWADKTSGDACTPFEPQFRAPWVPDQYAIRVVHDEPGRVTIDYDLMIRTRREEDARWRQREIEMANRFNVKDYEPGHPTAQMRHELGPDPVSDVLPRAAKAGNGWILGTRAHDANKPGDLTLAEALAREYPIRATVADATEDELEFGDEEAETEEQESRPRRKNRRREPVTVEAE